MDLTLCAPFTPEFASLTAEEFVRDILHRQIGVRQVYVGHNTSFGRGRTGSVSLLKEFGKRYGFAVEAVAAVEVKGTLLSSSRIRKLIRQGDIPGAAELLGRPPLLVGGVIHGFGRGSKKLGFPSANLKIDEVLVPRPGIFAVGRLRGAAVSGGRQPGLESDLSRPKILNRGLVLFTRVTGVF